MPGFARCRSAWPRPFPNAREAARWATRKPFVLHRLNDARKLGAQLLHCQPEEVALVGPTSLGLSFVAAGLAFRKGDNILIYHDDYPSNVYPWMALAERGVEVRLLNTRGLGIIRPQDVMGQVDENTRLVALASCHFISGYRIDLQAIGRFLRERGILFCLDAIQTLGAFPTTVEHVDFLAADAHKWLLGPCGAGLLYVRRELQERLNPPIYGWHNVRYPNFVAQEQIVFRRGAAKYEAGTHNLLGLVGLIAALELVLEIGVENIAAELLRKRAWLVPALQAKGFTVLNADAKPENAERHRFIPPTRQGPRGVAQKTDGCRRRGVVAHGSPGTKLHPSLAAFLQHGRGIATHAGIAVASGLPRLRLVLPAVSADGSPPPGRKRFARAQPGFMMQPDHGARVGHDQKPFGRRQLVRPVGQQFFTQRADVRAAHAHARQIARHKPD